MSTLITVRPNGAAAAHANPRTIPQLAAAAEALRPAGQRAHAGAAPGRAQPPPSCAPSSAERARLRHAPGERLTFARGGARRFTASIYCAAHRYDPVLARIERLVPGARPLADAGRCLQDRFVIPPDRLDPVMRAAIAECRRRTLAHIPLPHGEAFTLEFVTGQQLVGL